MKLKKSFFSETKCTRAYIFWICYHLVDLNQKCSYGGPWVNFGYARRVFYFPIMYIVKLKKSFSSETKYTRANIFGICYHLVDLYQKCSYGGPWVNVGHARRVFYFPIIYIMKLKKSFFSETELTRAYIFCICYHLADLYQKCSYGVPWVDVGHTRRVF